MSARPFLAALAAAATLAAAAPTHADPALPPGWTAGAPAKAIVPARAPSRTSVEGRVLAASPRRPGLAPVALSLEAFERVDVEPLLTTEEAEATRADPAGAPATDLTVDRGCSNASVAGHAVGTLAIGWASEPIGPNATGGPYLHFVRGSSGSNGRSRFVRALWETLDRMPDGTIRYIQGTGWFNLRTCATTLATRTVAIARPVFGGLAYLFRTRCARCAPASRDALHLLTPSTGMGNLPYDHHVLSLAADTADSVRVRVEGFRVDRFATAFGRAPATPRPGEDLLLGVEVTQALGEAAPSIIAYAAGVPHAGG